MIKNESNSIVLFDVKSKSSTILRIDLHHFAKNDLKHQRINIWNILLPWRSGETGTVAA